MCAYQLQCFTVGMVSSSNLAPGENESSWFCFCLFFYFSSFRFGSGQKPISPSSELTVKTSISGYYTSSLRFSFSIFQMELTSNMNSVKANLYRTTVYSMGIITFISCSNLLWVICLIIPVLQIRKIRSKKMK